ncbi:MAG: hypothetical protein JWM68_1359 [Verrucomicrobiales bacterium]|nr:hypothetical protein [Verrucomicrobiales bacterium]
MSSTSSLTRVQRGEPRELFSFLRLGEMLAALAPTASAEWDDVEVIPTMRLVRILLSLSNISARKPTRFPFFRKDIFHESHLFLLQVEQSTKNTG